MEAPPPWDSVPDMNSGPCTVVMMDLDATTLSTTDATQPDKIV